GLVKILVVEDSGVLSCVAEGLVLQAIQPFQSRWYPELASTTRCHCRRYSRHAQKPSHRKAPIKTPMVPFNSSVTVSVSRALSVCICQQISSVVAHTGNSTVCSSQSSYVGYWILDSGASDHVAGDRYLLLKLSPPKISQHITVADGSKAKVTGIGQATPLPELSSSFGSPKFKENGS
ncbi:receptor-like protein kinase, partial [Trifolium pratense]